MSEFESEAEQICSYRVLLRLTHLYGPAVRCKPKVNGGGWSCASVSGPCMERLCSWPSWISARTRSHSRKGPERPLGSPDHGYDGETVSPSPQFNSQTSAGSCAFLGCVMDQRGHPLGWPDVDLMRPLARRGLRSCDLVPTQSKRS